MAKIIKIGSQNLTPNKIANPFRTSRNSTTNPFKYSNFEGNTLQFADVFEGFQPKNTNKLKMIASSVTGSMNKMRSSIAEPIVNFVNRVRGGISSAWDYAKNTNMSDVPGFKQVNLGLRHVGEVLNTPIEIKALDMLSESMSNTRQAITDRVSNIGKGMSDKMSYLNKDIKEVGKDLSSQWESLISRIPSRKHYTASTPVADLENAWKEIISLGGVA